LTSKANDVMVQIKYKNLENTFSGNLQEVWLSINKLFLEFIPSLEIASNLMLKVDLQKLARDCEGIIAFSQEGPSILVSRNKLTDNDTLSLWLLAKYVGHQLGILKDEVVSKEELQIKLGKDAKITSTRLGELVKNETAVRTADEKYRITTFGIAQIQKETLPKIKAKMET
jgi:hypothetical protein